MSNILGIDVGGSGIKAGIVNVDTGEMITDRHKILTPYKSPKDFMINVINELVTHFDWKGKPIGIGFPAVIMDGHSKTANNIHETFIGFPITQAIEQATQCKTVVINDADAAGICEITCRKGINTDGTVILLTLGTGIGSAVFVDGKLLTNTELGQIIFNGEVAEKLISSVAREKREISWKQYGVELGQYLDYINKLFCPKQIIIGGGISKVFDKYKAGFPKHMNIIAADQLNNAGIVGAAMASKVYG